MTNAPKHARALACAIADIGQHEVPMGSNTGAFVITCQRATWLSGTNWPWCRAAVLKWRQEAGDIPGDRSAGAWDALSRATKRGEALAPQDYERTMPGDEVIWNIGSGHSSMLEKFEFVGGQVICHTIDGNASDMVKRCERPLSQVRGFIAWPETPLDKPSRRPLVHLVGSATGTRKLAVAGRTIPLPSKKEKVT